ncbi:MAG: hypothetical protein LW817_00590 [Candidatus Caenarcaniphilales bacterium]|jgi:hypothetical protein|nr:hypothetical protein [Candidatus Caenarcaniphilales bacterium]
MLIFQDKLGRYFTEKDYSKDQDLDLVTIDTSAFTKERVYKIEHEDFVATIPATMTLEDLDQDLLEQGFTTRLYAPKHYTLSRIIAEDWQHNLQRQVLGLEVVDINGQLTRSGSKVIKNVSGYDLNKLYIGSFNTLAIIHSLTLRLEALPDKQYKLRLDLSNLDIKKILNNKSLDFYYHLESNFFDDFFELSFEYHASQLLLEIAFAGKAHLAQTRVSKILHQLKNFKALLGLSLEQLEQITVSEIKYAKSYPNSNPKAEIHAKLSDLAQIFTELIQSHPNTKIKLLPFQSRIDFYCINASLPKVSLPSYIMFYPVTYQSRVFEKREIQNIFERKIIEELKDIYDPRNKLNPEMI